METGSDNSLPFGQGASAFGSEDGDVEDVIPERRLSLDLRHWEPVTDRYDVERAASPAPSYVSMHSDGWSSHEADEESSFGVATQVQLERANSSASSTFSLNSDEGTEGESKPERKSRKRSSSQASAAPPVQKPELQKDPNEKRHPALTVGFAFKALQSCLQKLTADELKSFRRMLWERYPECFRDPLDGLDIVDVVDKMLEICDIEVSLKITQIVLREMNLKKVADYLQGLCKRNEVRYELKVILKRKYENIYESRTQQGQPTLFDRVYTDLHITDGGNAAINSEHEFRQIEELQECGRGQKEVVASKDIFSPEIVKSRHVRTLMTKGSPGIGKSSIVQRFILDWVDGKDHQDVFFLIPLPFKELNQMADDKIGFMELICRLYPEMKAVDTLDFDDCRVMFICDGLDDCAVPIDFRRTPYWCDMNLPTTLRILITNLIRGNLLYSAYVWVTTRPVAINLIPAECIHQLHEVRGFTNEQREAYFRMVITNRELAERVIAHIKSCKTLYLMCHMPLFCWVVRNVLERDLQNLPAGTELPKAITHLYTNLLLIHIGMRGQKLQNSQPDSQESALNDQDFLMKLGRMAFQLLEKNLFRIEKEHWTECGLNVQDAVVTSGLCTQFYREKFVMYQEKVDCFIHPTMQEYIAALYVFLSFKNLGKNVLEGSKFKMFSSSKEPLVDLLKSAVDKALHAKNANYDIFVRFLLGMSVEANQDLLRSFLSSTGPSGQVQEEVARYIRKKIKENHYPEKNENLQRCLDELFSQPQKQ
ncbi:hypothetical protein NFI96_028795 [Prochilodus magdalenae]|nr:hypothetical protein NFI96_028795 [Prochilodus magdalenae]